MAGVSLRLESIYRRYGKVTAVNDLSLELPAGKFITLLGPSGCGKTTTLNLIAGLDQADGGSIHMGERDITRVPPNERGMAIVFQNYALYPHMSVFDNIAFGLRLQRRPKPEIQSRVRHTAELLAIEHLLDRRPGQLSGGQQQRVALGRAMVKRPAVFLLDEPFSNLDAALRARMRTEVKHLHQSLGTTSVFVTHDQEEAMTLSDLIAVMRDGKLVQYGTQHEVYGKPRDMYVATFLGKPRMSLIEGSLERHADEVVFTAPGLRLGLGTAASIGLHDGEWPRVAAGLRAEDVSLGAPGALSFDAQVALLEPIGSDTFVELEVGGATVVARVPPEDPVAVGDRVTAVIKPGRVHLFDLDSTERIVR
ncbi:ABC transporter ATP-binding protein [Dactylosporangium sp. NPDC050688]|uniref:ABC transporter ATP-binding protein n=1 Tax=Dactylosporangium sp. NPDC050688 TaxID=3157217 RepID=UPI0033E16BE3